LPELFGGGGGEPDEGGLGRRAVTPVTVRVTVGVVAGGGDAVGGGGLGCGEGAGEGAGGGAGCGLGRGWGRGRGLAEGAAARPATAFACARGPNGAAANGVVVMPTPPIRTVVAAAAGENDEGTARCCAAGSPPPDANDDCPTSSAWRQRWTDTPAPTAATVAKSNASGICFTVSVLPLRDDAKVQVVCGSTVTTRFFPCRLAS
jgi:hypothetical protein